MGLHQNLEGLVSGVDHFLFLLCSVNEQNQLLITVKSLLCTSLREVMDRKPLFLPKLLLSSPFPTI